MVKYNQYKSLSKNEDITLTYNTITVKIIYSN